MWPEPLPSQSVLHELMRYDPESGLLFWKNRSAKWFSSVGRGGQDANAYRWNTVFGETLALNTVSTTGYKKGRLIDRTVLSHRAIYKLVTGQEPLQIDHLDGDRQNNRISNLRSVTARENNRNRGLSKANKSGVIGVFFDLHVQKWKASIRGDNGRIIHLGTFEDRDAAIVARQVANVEHGYHPNHGAPRNANVLTRELGR